jgi:small subunit ribosomal protein S9
MLFTALKQSGEKKCSKAQAKFIPKNERGKITILINNKLANAYLQNNPVYINSLKVPLIKAGIENLHDLHISSRGGGLKGQVDAARLAISRLIKELYPEHKQCLKREGFLTQDSRSKERKKYGLKKARKAPQFSKR